VAGRQLDWPSSLVYVPRSHSFGSDAPSSSTYQPGLAGSHRAAFLDLAYVPNGHFAHSRAPEPGE